MRPKGGLEVSKNSKTERVVRCDVFPFSFLFDSLTLFAHTQIVHNALLETPLLNISYKNIFIRFKGLHFLSIELLSDSIFVE